MQADPLIGRTLGGFEIVAEIDHGGMGTVYRAYQPSLHREVAVKVLAPWLADRPGFRDRFMAEARTAARLRHPNVVDVYEVNEQDGIHYLAMELLPGESLASLVDREGTLPVGRVLGIARQIAAALDAAHAAGVVHRDVKPANVMIGPGDRVVLTDFGIARLLEGATRLTATGASVGTPAYMAPEQALGGTLTGATDQYALAVVLFELLAGRCPFEAPTPAALLVSHAQAAPPPLSSVRPGLPQALDHVLACGLAKQGAERFPHCTALVEAAAAAVEGRLVTPLSTPLATPVAGWAASPRPAGGRQKLEPGSMAAIAIAILVLAGLGGGLLLSTSTGPSLAARTPEKAPPAANGAAQTARQPAASVVTQAPSAVQTASPVVLVVTATPRPDIVIHRVEGGDTLNRVAQRYNVSPEVILQANGITDRNRILRIGEELRIPQSPRAIADVAAQATVAVAATAGARTPTPVAIARSEPTERSSPTSNITPAVAPVVQAPAPAAGPAGRIVIAIRAEGGAPALHLLTLGTDAPKRLTPPASGNPWAFAPAVSPDGTRVAFNYGTPGRTDIVVMGLDGSGRRVVAASNGKDLWGSPWWRADGTVTFHGVLAGEDGIFEATGGGQPRLLTDGGGVVPMLPTWPRVDGRVAYAGKESGIWRIWVLGDNGRARPISPAGIESYAPAWSPDGRQLAFQGGGAGIQTAASDSSDRRILVPSEPGIWTHAPAWSPDGRWIAYVSGRQDVHENFGDLYVVPATGGQPARITNLGTVYDWRPAWVP